jgi:predicted nucleotidyltransferase
MDAEEARIKMMEYFKFLIDDVLGMLIYGSVATGASTERSDIDVCVVAPLVADKYSSLCRFIFKWM